ncbi:MAG: Flp pilus assembly protein CpaB [Myxococcota bacterium]
MKGKAPIIIAVLLAIMAAYIVQRIISNEQRKIREKWTTTKILVAAQPIRARTPLTVDIVEEGDIPDRYYTESMLTPGDLELNRRQLIMHAIEKGQPIYYHNLEGQTKELSLGQKLRAGGRAITIPVNPSSSIGYWLSENDHVDIIGTFQNMAGKNAQMVALTILENIIVLKTGNKGKGVNDPGSQDNKFQTVTLLMMPGEAEMLVLARQIGKITLTLRNPDDRGLIEERAWTTLKTLLTRERAKKLRMKRIQTLDTIKILRGVGKNIPVNRR